MNSFEIVEVVIVDIDADAKVESGVSSVDDLEVSKFDKVRVFGISNGHNGVYLLDQLLLLLVVKVHVPFGQPKRMTKS